MFINMAGGALARAVAQATIKPLQGSNGDVLGTAEGAK
jgi:hypothetical protein